MKKLMAVILVAAVCFFADSKIGECGSLEKGMVTITFDAHGGYIPMYAEKIIVKNKLTATAYVVTDETGDGEHPTWTHVLKWYDMGWEIGNHGFRHIHLIEQTKEKILHDLCASQAQLVAHGITDAHAFAPPYGEADDRLKCLLREVGFLTSSRQVKTGDDPPLNDVESFDPWSLNVVDLRNFTTADDVIPFIEQAATEKKWLILVIQGMSKKPSSDDVEVQAKVFAKIAKTIRKSAKRGDISVVNVTDGVNTMLSAQE